MINNTSVFLFNNSNARNLIDVDGFTLIGLNYFLIILPQNSSSQGQSKKGLYCSKLHSILAGLAQVIKIVHGFSLPELYILVLRQGQNKIKADQTAK